VALTPRQAADRLRQAGQFEELLEKILQRGGRLIGERAVNRFMRDTGPTNEPNRLGGRGSLRQQTGRLARSYLQTRGRIGDTDGSGESIVDIETSETGAVLRKGSEVPYAAVHEFGYTGVQQVEAHTRRITEAFGEPIEPQTVQVSAHRRPMSMPERPHLRPGLNAAAPDVVEYSRKKLFELVDEAFQG